MYSVLLVSSQHAFHPLVDFPLKAVNSWQYCANLNFCPNVWRLSYLVVLSSLNFSLLTFLSLGTEIEFRLQIFGRLAHFN